MIMIMSSTESNTNRHLERNRDNNQETHITQFLQRENQIKHKGYIDRIKLSESTCILSLNPNGLNPWDEIQTTMLTQAFK